MAKGFLSSWRVELASDDGEVVAAVAVLPPSDGHRRGYGASWDRRDDSPEGFAECVEQLVALAATSPDLDVLQVAKPSADTVTATRLRVAGFVAAYPVWEMTHDGLTWPDEPPRLPKPLRLVGWDDTSLSSFHVAYVAAYQDQRLVEPHTADAWLRMTTGDHAFADDLARLAVTPEGEVVSYVLGFRSHSGGLDLGPVGTIPEWRRRGLSSSLLATTLREARDTGITSITLTTDGDSPTNSQRLYERFGFEASEKLIAFQRVLADSDRRQA